MKKIIIKSLQVIFVLLLMLCLVIEVFETSFFIKGDVMVVYTAVITTLCWLLAGWLLMPYKKLHYCFFVLVAAVFAYLYFLQEEIVSAHAKQVCVETGENCVKG